MHSLLKTISTFLHYTFEHTSVNTTSKLPQTSNGTQICTFRSFVQHVDIYLMCPHLCFCTGPPLQFQSLIPFGLMQVAGLPVDEKGINKQIG
jgi:hypothetical protein